MPRATGQTPPRKTTKPATTKAGPVETAMSRLVTGMRRRHQLTTSGEVQAAMCIAAARGLDQALAADNAYGIRQSIVSLRELVTDLHTPAADRADPIDALIANLASGPIRD